MITYAELFTSLAAAISKAKKVVFDFAVVDEAQDIGMPIFGFSRLLEVCDPMHCCSLAISASASSSSHSRGRLSASYHIDATWLFRSSVAFQLLGCREAMLAQKLIERLVDHAGQTLAFLERNGAESQRHQWNQVLGRNRALTLPVA
jgi:hypothetical protein